MNKNIFLFFLRGKTGSSACLSRQRYKMGSLEPEIRQLCLFTVPSMFNVAQAVVTTAIIMIMIMIIFFFFFFFFFFLA